MKKKTLIIIAIVLVIVLVAYFLIKNKDGKRVSVLQSVINPNNKYDINDISTPSLDSLSKSIDDKTLADTKGIIDALKKDTKMTQQDKDMFLRVWKGVLYAKKDKNWDDKSKDVAKKKQILMGYGVKESEIDWFIKRTS